MAVTITLENIPDDIYARLIEAAQTNHHSINSEVLACLEKALLSAHLTNEERLARARELRSTLKPGTFNLDDISNAIEQGRP